MTYIHQELLPINPLISISALIGSALCILSSICLSVHIIWSYHTFPLHKKSKRKQTLHALVVACNLLSLSTAISFTFVRSNWFTQRTPSSMTATQCSVGYFLYYVSSATLSVTIKSILLYLIHVSFNGSVLVYRLCTKLVWCVIIWISWLCVLINRILTVLHSDGWILYYDASSDVFYCTPQINQTRNLHALIGAIIAGVDNVIIMLSLLFMFTCSLRQLQKLVSNVRNMADVQQKTHVGKANSVEMSTPDVIAMEVVSTQMDNTRTNRKMMTLSLSRLDKANTMELHELAKKQTILVTTIVLSILVWMALTAVHGALVYEFGWCYTVNMVALWLMLATNSRWWSACTTRGLCMCCYRRR